MNGWVLMIGGAVCTVVSAVNLAWRRYVVNHGESVQGTVTRARRSAGNRNTTFITVVYRTQEGRNGSLRRRTTLRGLEPGDGVGVYCLPGNPDRAVLDDYGTLLSGVGIGVSLILLYIGLAQL